MSACKALGGVTDILMSPLLDMVQFGVPKFTLREHVSGRVLSGATSSPQTYLDRDEEELVLRCAEIAYAKSRKQVLALVRRLLQKKKESYD